MSENRMHPVDSRAELIHACRCALAHHDTWLREYGAEHAPLPGSVSQLLRDAIESAESLPRIDDTVPMSDLRRGDVVAFTDGNATRVLNWEFVGIVGNRAEFRMVTDDAATLADAIDAIDDADAATLAATLAATRDATLAATYAATASAAHADRVARMVAATRAATVARMVRSVDRSVPRHAVTFRESRGKT